MFDLEVWLIGTPDELDAAVTALAGAGRVLAGSTPEPLYGADRVRQRRYLQVRIPTGNAAGQTGGRESRTREAA